MTLTLIRSQSQAIEIYSWLKDRNLDSGTYTLLRNHAYENMAVSVRIDDQDLLAEFILRFL